MFVLSPSGIESFDVSGVRRFVDFWSQFYKYEVKVLGGGTTIDYFSELNLGSDLTEQNVRRLLRWKDPRRLTDPRLHGTQAGEHNDSVARVLEKLEDINKFRCDLISEEKMREIVTDLFPKGIIFQVFLFNIAKPYRYPIADQHVFRTYGLHMKLIPKVSWDQNVANRTNFSQIATELSVEESLAHVQELKRIDDALMAFGKFLKNYYTDAKPAYVLDEQ